MKLANLIYYFFLAVAIVLECLLILLICVFTYYIPDSKMQPLIKWMEGRYDVMTDSLKEIKTFINGI